MAACTNNGECFLSHTPICNQPCPGQADTSKLQAQIDELAKASSSGGQEAAGKVETLERSLAEAAQKLEALQQQVAADRQATAR